MRGGSDVGCAEFSRVCVWVCRVGEHGRRSWSYDRVLSYLSSYLFGLSVFFSCSLISYRGS